MYEFRPWMMKRADTTCGYCGDGCSLILETRGGKVIEVMSSHGNGRNNGDLCARGFFGYQYVNHADRLTTPLVRQADGALHPVTWDEVRVLNGRPMENITVARRSGKDWYVGSITNWDARSVKVPLDFLGEGKYVAEIYADALDAGTNATHTTFTKQDVDRSTVLEVKMVSGGGNAIWVHPSR